MAKNAAVRDWVYTLNNYTEDEIAALQSIDCLYHVMAKEVAPETGTPHLQAYIYFKNRGRRFGGVRKLPGMARAHLEAAKGTPTENKNYCTGMCAKKNFVLNDWVWEFGELPQSQGERNDITAIKEMVKKGAGMREVLEVATSYQAAKHAELLMKHMSEPIDRDPNTFRVYWYWGPTGTGKTHAARTEAGADTWVSGNTLKFWNGYDGHKNVIFDDFRRNMCTFVDLLHYTEPWGYTVDVKGSHRPLRYTSIWITAPKHPRELWEGRTDEELDQLLDRIHVIREFSGPSIRKAKKLEALLGVPSILEASSEISEFPAVPPSVPKVGGNSRAPTSPQNLTIDDDIKLEEKECQFVAYEPVRIFTKMPPPDYSVEARINQIQQIIWEEETRPTLSAWSASSGQGLDPGKREG